MTTHSGTPGPPATDVEVRVDHPEPTPMRVLRIGYISQADPNDLNFLSGMPYAARKAMSRQPGVEVIPLLAVEQTSRRPILGRSRLGGLAGRIGRRLVGWSNFIPRWDDHHRIMRTAAAQSRYIESQIAGADLDLIFGICISVALAQLRTDLPVFYAGDATWRLVRETYPEFSRSSSGTSLAFEEIERASLRRLTLGFFASKRTLESAVEDYGMGRQKVRLVPLGANVVPEPGEILAPQPPEPSELRLLTIAVDPHRKRLDFCVSVAEQLARKTGRKVNLVHIGYPTRRARRSPLVTCLGFLRLSDPEHRRLQQNELRSCHLLLLPSVGEMFGIAPCEAAHFGRPSIVSDVGGLPTVVDHGQTGLVLPLSATPADYVQAIENLWSDPQTYAAMSRRCLERARSVFTWDAWAAAIVRDIRDSMASQETQAKNAQ